MTPNANEPDWERLQRIAAQAEQESRKPGWNRARWQQLLEQALEASHGHGEFTEFLAAYMPDR